MPTITGCGRDWTALPSDLLAAIASRLTLIDYSTSAKCANPGPARLPHNTLHRLSVPGLRDKHCIGSQHGWLATLDPLSELALLNPSPAKKSSSLRRHPPQRLRLPRPRRLRLRLPHTQPSLPWFNFRPLPPNLFRNASFSKLAFARAGEDRWHLYEDEYPDRRYEDVAFCGGRLLALTSQGALLAVELDGDYTDCKVVVYDPQDEQFGTYRKYLVVDDATGDLLQVRRELGSGDDDRCSTVRTESITVTRLDEERNVWIPVESLGDRALFVGVGSSVLLSGKEVRGLRRNCVYFTDDRWNLRFSEDVKGDRRDVGIYCLEDGSVQPCLPPDDRFNWPPPVWISPSLSQVN
uniref:KIB1-4 beta-propeller domain-containing protein n=1 Tax=Ananas comosus var. bracteatus TaxID=296719 RepID=A0A6V7P560_ANACO|nr:unnamed protein product [Ananas comosus var. bracteatus]